MNAVSPEQERQFQLTAYLGCKVLRGLEHEGGGRVRDPFDHFLDERNAIARAAHRVRIDIDRRLASQFEHWLQETAEAPDESVARLVRSEERRVGKECRSRW